MKELRGSIEGMDCADCALKIKKALSQLEGVENVELNLVSTKLLVKFDDEKINERDIIQKVKKLGYGFSATYQKLEFFNIKKNRSLQLLLIGTLFFVLGIIFEHLYPFKYFYLLFVLSYLIGGFQIYKKAWASIKVLSLDINVLMVIAVIGASIINKWSEASEIVLLFALAEMLEAYAMDRSRKAIKALMDLTPPTAIKLIGKEHMEVNVEDLMIGDRIIVKPGGKIPADGKIEWGEGLVDQSPITGESTPVYKTIGHKVYAGTINIDGSLIIVVTQLPQESTISRIIKLIENAEQYKSKSEQFINKFAKVYTPIMLLIAILTTVIPVVFMDQSFSVWFYRSLIIVIVSCPCALVLATPITIVTAITRASRKGVLIKGGKYIEALSDIKAIAIDKTGTLSLGKLKVYKIEAYNGFKENEILSIAYSLEKHVDHPIAQAIVEDAEKNEIEEKRVEKIELFKGKGVRGIIEGKEYYIGNELLVKEVQGNKKIDYCDEYESIVSYVFDTKNILGHIHLSDQLRPEAKKVVNELKSRGLDVVMLTGDNRFVATKIAEELQIDCYYELLPENKVEKIKEIKEKYKTVAMVGDGINDAPSLAIADVGIAMGTTGTAIAIETADVVLANDNLENIPYLHKLSKKTKLTIMVNVFLALAIKLSFFILAVLGLTSLWLTVLFGDTGASLIVILNALRLGKEKKRKIKKHTH